MEEAPPCKRRVLRVSQATERTRRNWKNSYGFDIPDEKFEAFKANKKLYIQLRQIKEQLDKDILAMVLGED